MLGFFALFVAGRSRVDSCEFLASNVIRFEGEEGVVSVKRLLAPVPMPNTIVGIGLNYWGHINATHSDPPPNPSIFFKNKYSYNHPFNPVIIPASSDRPDYEGELGVIIGKRLKDVSEDEALDYVLGYTVCHDVSARCFQNTENGKCPGNGGQFSFSKGFDTHAPWVQRLF